MTAIIQSTGYLIATLLFILGLKKLTSPKTAQTGNRLSALGMFIAVGVTCIQSHILSYEWIIAGIAIGSIIGIIAATRVAMTSMPELVALFNGLGGGSSLLVAIGVYLAAPALDPFSAIICSLSIIIGAITFSGSIIAWGKLATLFPGKPLTLWGHNIINLLLVLCILTTSALFIIAPIANAHVLPILIATALVLGMTSVLAIGGGDMPVVIALLNSYSGIAAAAAGMVIGNLLLIVAGILVGASGLILTSLMCKAMNRSLKNVLFSNFGSTSTSQNNTETQGSVTPMSTEDAYYVLEAARSVVIIPGYGMAVAQAQHTVRELADFLEENGCDVKYAIHPVAGRMPGHMNVLLAEANIPYTQLYEMDAINPTLPHTDICLVIGANDVVNPDANTNPDSPIYGMPIINATDAKHVFVFKRSMNPGFAGIENPLFYKDNTSMIFGDAKESIQHLIGEFKG